MSAATDADAAALSWRAWARTHLASAVASELRTFRDPLVDLGALVLATRLLSETGADDEPGRVLLLQEGRAAAMRARLALASIASRVDQLTAALPLD